VASKATLVGARRPPSERNASTSYPLLLLLSVKVGAPPLCTPYRFRDWGSISGYFYRSVRLRVGRSRFYLDSLLRNSGSSFLSAVMLPFSARLLAIAFMVPLVYVPPVLPNGDPRLVFHTLIPDIWWHSFIGFPQSDRTNVPMQNKNDWLSVPFET